MMIRLLNNYIYKAEIIIIKMIVLHYYHLLRILIMINKNTSQKITKISFRKFILILFRINLRSRVFKITIIKSLKLQRHIIKIRRKNQ